MDERIHACLDGELAPEALTPSERARLAALESSVAEAAAVLRAAPVPDFTARVMAALPAAPAPAPVVPSTADRLAELWARGRAWLWEPRQVSFRPAYALAGAMSVVMAAVLAPGAVEDPRVALAPSAQEAPAAGAKRLYVQFRLEAPEASQVRLAGSFNEWEPSYELREAAPGVWTALVPLAPGVHDYTFVVDGEEWVADPYAPQVDDSFGGTNSRLFLPAPAGSV